MAEDYDVEKELKALLGDVHLSEEGKKFLSSDIGRYLINCALDEEEEARLQWVDINPEDSVAIRALQLKAKIPNLMFSWIRDAIRNGEEAKQILEQESQNGR